MLTTSRGISLILAFAISALVAAFLSLMPDSTPTVLLVAGGLTFSVSYLLITITLEFLVFREIGNIYSLLEKIQKKDLSEIHDKSIRASLSPLRKNNSVINSYALARQKEIDTLQKTAEFRREFIADISHELKTPIFATQGYIHTLLDGAIEDKQVRMKFLKRAAKSLDSLDVLVQDLLTLNQMESGVVKFNFTDSAQDLPSLPKLDLQRDQLQPQRGRGQSLCQNTQEQHPSRCQRHGSGNSTRGSKADL